MGIYDPCEIHVSLLCAFALCSQLFQQRVYRLSAESRPNQDSHDAQHRLYWILSIDLLCLPLQVSYQTFLLVSMITICISLHTFHRFFLPVSLIRAILRDDPVKRYREDDEIITDAMDF